MKATVPLRYWFWWPAKTLDPYEGDRPPVMQVVRNIYAPLVSSFLDGKPQGMIAQDWQVDETGQIWRFQIRPGLIFDDGVPITAEAVLKNFRRILWLTRNEGLVLNSLMSEVASWKDYNAPLKSLYVEKDSVVFKFNRRPVDLFEAISQAIYGIANPKCFDEQGRWKDPFCSSASGQYKIKERSTEKIVLQSRHIFPSVPYAPEMVEIYAPKNTGDNVVGAILDGRGDLTVEHSFGISRKTLGMVKDAGLKIAQEPPVRMHFVQLNAARPPFKNRAIRRSIRDFFLRLLENDMRFASSGIEVDPSFIPKGGVGYLRFDPPSSLPIEKVESKGVEVLFFPIAAEPEIQQAIEGNVIDSLRAHGFLPKVSRYPDRFEAFNRLREGDFDVIVRGTGILINNPYADLRMMFMSKLGAIIPDPSGAIPKMIEGAEMERDPIKRAKVVEQINATIFEDAAVVTFAHSNLLYIYRDGVDLSRLNLFVDPIEFRAVSWRPTQGQD